MPKRKINKEIADRIRKQVSSGKPQKVIAIEYKLSEGSVSKIVNYKRYK